MSCSEIVDFWHLGGGIEVQREIGSLGLVSLVDNGEGVNASGELLGPPAHCSEAFVGHPLVLLLVNRLVL